VSFAQKVDWSTGSPRRTGKVHWLESPGWTRCKVAVTPNADWDFITKFPWQIDLICRNCAHDALWVKQ
jgi:hypothetical protein